MIASPAISQKNYIIGSDTIVGYTKKENRKIAIIFQDRNKLEELNFDNEELIFHLQNSNLKLQDNIKQYLIADSINNSRINKINVQLDKEIKSKNNWKTIGTTSTVVAVLFIIVSLIK